MKFIKFSKPICGFKFFVYPLELSITQSVFTNKWNISFTNHKTGKYFVKKLA